MAQDAISADGEPPTPEPEPAQKVDQIDELIRIVGEQDAMPPPRRAKALTHPNRLRRTKGRR
jgi:hypothetical protein